MIISTDDQRTTRYYDDHRRLHREAGPAVIYYHHDRWLHPDGEHFTDIDTATGSYKSVREWWINGKRVAGSFKEWGSFLALQTLSDAELVEIKLAFGGDR